MRRPNHPYRRLRRAPRLVRIALGLVLIAAGLFGFLPLLGFWMVPLGLAVIFIDAPPVRRAWSRLRQRWRAWRARGKPGARPRAKP